VANQPAHRDMKDLRAGINHHAKEGYHRGIVRVVLLDRGTPRDRWLMLIPLPDHSEFMMYGNDVMDLTKLGLHSI
jgi:hypothetical protein